MTTFERGPRHTPALSGVRVRLLGRVEVEVDGAATPLMDSPRAGALLAHLLLHRDGPQARQRVAHLFWPDSTGAQARTNLRHLLHTLRAGLAEAQGYLEITSSTLWWRGPEAGSVDVEEFERLLGLGGEDRRWALLDAVGLYRGDLLEGHADEWLTAERDRLRHRYLDALADLAEQHEERGDLAAAIAAAERLRGSDPLREEVYRLLMRLHAARGERARALAVYHECCSTLDRELGVAPAPQTRAAYAALLPPPSGAAEPSPPVRASLVGRGAERAALTAAWRSAEAGHPRLVLVSGEAGVGKTRLVEEFRSWCARRGAVVADARCYAAEGRLSYEPIVQWLRSPAVRARVPQLDRHRLSELARLLPELPAEMPGLDAPSALPEEELRHRLLDAVGAAVLPYPGSALLVVDDIQDVDRETCAVVHYLLRSNPDARLLVVATARRGELDERHPVRELLAGLHELRQCTEIELDPFDRVETAVLAERLTGTPLTDDELGRLHAETEGNALFVVEAARAGWNVGGPISPRVQAVIEARLAQLSGSTRELVDVAALIGREFDADVLAAASGLDEELLVRGLDELWRRRIIRERGTPAYDFGHDKIREVAAAGVSPARRRLLHLRIAAALDRGDPGRVSGRIATHYAQAGADADAAGWYRRAAEAAQLLHANGEVVELLDRALEHQLALPGSPDRDAAEMDLRTAALAPLAAVAGYGAPRLVEAQARVGELTTGLGRRPAPPLLRSLAMTASSTADFAGGMRIGRELHAAGARDGNDVLLVEGAFVVGATAFWTADFELARHFLDQAVERYRPADRGVHLVHYGNDPKVSCLARLGNTRWFLGDPAGARAARAGAVAWAEEIGHGYSRGIAHWFGSLLALDMGDDELLRVDSAALSVADDSHQLRLAGAALRGHLAVLHGAPTDGIAAVRAAIAGSDGAPAPGLQASLYRVLLAAQLAARDIGAAVTADQLLRMGAGAQVWAAEARRVRAAFRGRSG